jgi:hypothetical protein
VSLGPIATKSSGPIALSNAGGRHRGYTNVEKGERQKRPMISTGALTISVGQLRRCSVMRRRPRAVGQTKSPWPELYPQGRRFICIRREILDRLKSRIFVFRNVTPNLIPANGGRWAQRNCVPSGLVVVRVAAANRRRALRPTHEIRSLEQQTASVPPLKQRSDPLKGTVGWIRTSRLANETILWEGRNCSKNGATSCRCAVANRHASISGKGRTAAVLGDIGRYKAGQESQAMTAI